MKIEAQFLPQAFRPYDWTSRGFGKPATFGKYFADYFSHYHTESVKGF